MILRVRRRNNWFFWLVRDGKIGFGRGLCFKEGVVKYSSWGLWVLVISFVVNLVLWFNSCVWFVGY